MNQSGNNMAAQMKPGQQLEKRQAVDPLLVGADDAAKLLGIGRSLFYSLHSSGQLGPLPIRLGRRALWRREELAAWIRAGCPGRTRWVETQEAW